MDPNEIQDITDIAELEFLQGIQDALGRMAGVSSVILDGGGLPVTRPFAPLCDRALDSSWEETKDQLLSDSRESGQPALAVCPDSGLRAAVVPLALGNRFLGGWFVGQLSGETPEEGSAGEAAVREAPGAGRRDFDSTLALLTALAGVITRPGATAAASAPAGGQPDLSSKMFKDFIDLTDVGVYILDYETGELLMVNDLYASFFGIPSEELLGRFCFHQLNEESWCSFCPRDRLLDANGEPGDPVVWENYLGAIGVWLRITSRAIRWVDERLVLMVTFIDITEQKKHEEEIIRIAYYDHRLNTPNGMRLFMDINTHRGREQSIICFDILGLRKINDAYGRETGDLLLGAIRDWVISLEGCDLELYRVDGDEFAVLFPQKDAHDLQDLTQKLWRRFEETWVVGQGEVQRQIFISASMGIIPCKEGYSSYAELLGVIERVLSTAKSRNTPVTYDAQVAEEFHNHLQLEINLKNAVLNGMQGFHLHYQPIVEPVSGRWRGLETLCRWSSPELGPVSPAVFIPEIEQLGLIFTVGEWVLDQAVSQMKEWGMDQLDGFILDVNLSPLQLSDRRLAERLLAILLRHDYPPHKLCLEITESAEVQFDDHIKQSLDIIRQTGISLSLDDFGTGYASFSSLHHLPVDTIKTDRSFAQELQNEESLQHTVHIIVEFSHAAGKKVIAEGVETEEQMQILLESGVDYFQGFFFSKPLPPEEMTAHFDNFSFPAVV